ncbi:MAG: hypothetical protein Hyperionvirus12_23 [Hyperionvirus sp.]|uniref:Uncharacterized protein n=1 Tax=Hyperionvirus sp. TaxID=2487770 RepID=A0A3G5A971_9VIRU|nr:MAG: hypothetical protein Hyperionvirus12_23 [Hyperionvirus sp.]
MTEVLLWIILVIVVIILAIMGYVLYSLKPLLTVMAEIKNLNYRELRPIATDLVRTVVLPEMKTSFDRAIKEFIDNFFKGQQLQKR